MSLRRKVARARVKYRRISESRAAKKERKLMLERNKALKEAAAVAQRAQLIEEKRAAEAKKMAAEDRLRIAQGKGRKGKRGSAVQSGRSALKSIVGVINKLKEIDRRAGGKAPKRHR